MGDTYDDLDRDFAVGPAGSAAQRERVRRLQSLNERALEEKREMVDHPDHYGGADNPYEAVKVIEAWGLGWHLGDATKYISRAGKKFPDKEIEDLEKAVWYIQRRITYLKAQQ